MVSLLVNTNKAYQPACVLLAYLQQIGTKERPYSLDRSNHSGMSYCTKKNKKLSSPMQYYGQHIKIYFDFVFTIFLK